MESLATSGGARGGGWLGACTRSAGVICVLRTLAESKFLLLLGASAFVLLQRAQKLYVSQRCSLDRDEAACPAAETESFCASFEQCVFEGEASLYMGVDLSDTTNNVFLILLLCAALVNLIAFWLASYLCLREGQGKRSDLACCYTFNRLYTTRPFRFLWYFNLIIFLGCTVVQVAIAAYLEMLLTLLKAEISGIAAAMVSLIGLYAPSKNLAEIPFETYRKHLKVEESGDDFAGFAWSDLLSGAPSVLTAKLTEAAIADEVAEMVAEGKTSML